MIIENSNSPVTEIPTLPSRDILKLVPALTEDERIEARKAAKEDILALSGDKPVWEDFMNNAVSKYPRSLTRTLFIIMGIALAGAFAITFFRMFTVGRDYFFLSIQDKWQANIAGLAIFALSESVVVSSGLIKATFFDPGKGKFLLINMVLGSVLAYAGNIVASHPHDVFSWLEALLPTTFVFILVLGIERMALKSMEARYENKVAYEAALADWSKSIEDPENHRDFTQRYANHLWSALRQSAYNSRRSNERKSEKLAFVNSISTLEKRRLVQRELEAERWFMTPTLSEKIDVTAEAVSANPTGPSNPKGWTGQPLPSTRYGFQTEKETSDK